MSAPPAPSAQSPLINSLCLIGTGLIGGSLARDLKRLGLVGEVVGCSRNEANLERAVDLGFLDRYDTSVPGAATGADVVVVAVPLGATEAVFEGLRPAVAAGVIVTDAGSAKQCVIEAAERVFGEVPSNLVPGHPIAGTEHSGVDAAIEHLYEGRRVILTPLPATSEAALAKVRAMWSAVGAEVLDMDPHHHDEVLAATSHLPHMLAFTLMDVLGRMNERVEIFRYAAGGLRDFTRVASSDPQMWHDICIANREALVEVLERFQADLSSMTEAIRSNEVSEVKDTFARAKSLRDTYVVNR